MINSDNKFKVIFLGNSGVGKSSIILRICNEKFDPAYHSTVGLDFTKKDIIHNKSIMKLLFYDTAGQEKFRSLIPMYIRDANIMIIVYDITNYESFTQLQIWMDMIADLRREDAIVAIVGNKQDMEERRAVQIEEAKEFAKKNNSIFKEVSAKMGTNIQDLINIDIVKEVTSHYKLKDNSDQQNNPNELQLKDESSIVAASEIETNKQNSLRLNDSKEEENPSNEKKKKKCC
jgi:Ras-related protein Rab-6A